MKKLVYYFICLVFLTSCIPNTYYSTTDPYTRGLRFFDRGMQHNSEEYMIAASNTWKPLVAKGDCDAEYRLGLLYFAGWGGNKQSFDTAYKLWKKAANGNQQRAQFALGDLYFQDDSKVYHHCRKTPGCNIKKDLEKAFFWYKLAEKSAKYDNEKDYLNQILRALKQEISAQQRSNIVERVDSWLPTPKDCNARDLW